MTTTLPYQPSVYLIVEIPYGGIPMDDRDDFDIEVTETVNGVLHDLTDGEAKSVLLLDEHGIADWMHEVIKRGLVSE